MSASPLPTDDRPEHETALMGRIGRGDREAFALLYELYGARVMRFLVGLSVDHATAEDLVQETFLRVWSAAPRWRPTGRVSTWIFQIAKRLWWKRAARRRTRPAVEGEAAARREAGPHALDPGTRASHAEEIERLRSAIHGLSPRLRLVFVLIRLEGLPYGQAAVVAGIRTGTVKSRMAAAEARLRKLLGEA